MKLKAKLSYSALKYGIPIKGLNNSFSSFKWIFNRAYIKNRVFSSFEYSLNSNKYVVLSRDILLFKTNNLENSFSKLINTSIFFSSIYFIDMLKQEKLKYLVYFSSYCLSTQ